jgi:hypothetical protein
VVSLEEEKEAVCGLGINIMYNVMMMMESMASHCHVKHGATDRFPDKAS